jgi:hypothetical protein
MPVPETTSAEALERYVVGKKIAASKGPAWKDVQLSVFSLPPVAEVFTMPAATEPLLVWISSGEAEAQERESNGPWLTSHLKKDSLFLTTAGAPYDFRWRTSALSRSRSCSSFSASRSSARRSKTFLVRMPSTLSFETFLASKIRILFRSYKNCERRR